MADKLIKLCGLFENVSKQTGKTYFSGALSYSSKILIFQEQDAPDGQPGWTMYISERTPKPRPAGEHGVLTGEIPATDYPPRRSTSAGGSMRWTRKG